MVLIQRMLPNPTLIPTRALTTRGRLQLLLVAFESRGGTRADFIFVMAILGALVALWVPIMLLISPRRPIRRGQRYVYDPSRCSLWQPFTVIDAPAGLAPAPVLPLEPRPKNCDPALTGAPACPVGVPACPVGVPACAVDADASGLRDVLVGDVLADGDFHGDLGPSGDLGPVGDLGPLGDLGPRTEGGRSAGSDEVPPVTEMLGTSEQGAVTSAVACRGQQSGTLRDAGPMLCQPQEVGGAQAAGAMLIQPRDGGSVQAAGPMLYQPREGSGVQAAGPMLYQLREGGGAQAAGDWAAGRQQPREADLASVLALSSTLSGSGSCKDAGARRTQGAHAALGDASQARLSKQAKVLCDRCAPF